MIYYVEVILFHFSEFGFGESQLFHTPDQTAGCCLAVTWWYQFYHHVQDWNIYCVNFPRFRLCRQEGWKMIFLYEFILFIVCVTKLIFVSLTFIFRTYTRGVSWMLCKISPRKFIFNLLQVNRMKILYFHLWASTQPSQWST